MFKHFSLSHVSAGFVAVLVGYTSSAAIIFQAVGAAGAGPAELGSWLWALGIGMGVTCIGLSLAFRAPILTAWSTPGAALLVSALAGLSMGQAVGAFLFCSALIALCGFLGWFDRLMRHVPRALAAAMLAGVLLRFGLELFGALRAAPWMVAGMCALYLGGRRLLPRYAVPLALAGGLLIAAAQGQIRFEAIELAFARPLFTAPEFSLSTLIGVGLPLFVVTMASQNVPGLAVLRANGYSVPAAPLVGWTGATGVLLAPFGGFAYNLAAITAAICMSRDADPDPARRYLASVWAGVFYLITGLLGATVAGLFAAFPHALVAAIAGLALIGTIANSLAVALEHEAEREAALVTFLTTASGFGLLGIGGAFWGLVFGLATLHALRRRAAA
ncbi:benzoate/H(+) symporter BenE family transporter [Pseudothauera nasutitermitis]|uniref:Benzoate/H(+) symporter BenE family transporter n=1 Tax=Pseudothauera nasutitermitis TaxID=2565930 RepID=A0A4V6RX99_9RHOO|nr:benzoate/H(+) symporter BenE family transporter [Pseudothauera nasutitermitis]THF66984.1 benzoate/H(+) symporter BenE family transporter [Pseudothauera nasutitermitis]